MKIEQVIAAIRAEYYPQCLWGEDWDSGCPCFDAEIEVDGHTVTVWGRCWRVSEHYGEQDLYVDSESMDEGALRRIGEAYREQLDAQAWYSPYRLLINQREPLG